ncbi:MAG: PstS family phosphate ABC transporter substrate-binding protein [Polyangiales bacterium]
MVHVRCVAAAAAALAVACSGHPAATPSESSASVPSDRQPSEAPDQSATSRADHAVTGDVSNAVIRIDGSSTVYPITEAAAEEFQKQHPAKVTIGVSGTGGGFTKLCAGEIAIAGASRPIKAVEQQACAATKVELIELPVAYDGLAVVVHPKNTWATSLSVDELKKIWEPAAQQKITRWSQVRAGWPDRPLHLFGPGVDSGTYDYFTKAIVGEEHQSRGDYTSSEDDNVLVQGVSRDEGGLGFFGLAYYEENADKLKLIPIDDGVATNGQGPIVASTMTVEDGTYQPLSRPIFLYVAKAAHARPEVRAFIDFYLDHGPSLVKEAHYIALPARAYQLAHKRFDSGSTGSLFAGKGSEVGVTVEALLARE